jgi:hypothetical protein
MLGTNGLFARIGHAGYKPKDIVVLTDDSPHQRSQPTRKNIIDAMHWLVRDARPHDALFVHCAPCRYFRFILFDVG